MYKKHTYYIRTKITILQDKPSKKHHAFNYRKYRKTRHS